MVQALDKSTTSSAHKGVLQSTEQNSVELLDIVLIGSLAESKRTTLCTKISGSVVSLTHLCIILTYWEPTTILCRDSEPVPAETIHSHAFSHQINKHATGLCWNAYFLENISAFWYVRCSASQIFASRWQITDIPLCYSNQNCLWGQLWRRSADPQAADWRIVSAAPMVSPWPVEK